ncbi:uncharacterized protein ARB_01767 [Trichophyton benhamiae CBS 112371]|uniref:Uncharacterized protein n=1 Tax=Arthroderma benhamiae (strain ATCC MYA-4681 / CBS 112371) TaxID=663331 RepID=D4AZZ6_ARTBC|nr:uncharacterized protein ARB_01767 [Trichophyton benhamiae CBS 112371]EFE31371.1 hypothetical protein ARB_01767 [Trichophyton benhamiae CBS 112371]
MDPDNVQALAFRDAYHVNSTLLRQRDTIEGRAKREKKKRKKQQGRKSKSVGDLSLSQEEIPRIYYYFAPDKQDEGGKKVMDGPAGWTIPTPPEIRIAEGNQREREREEEKKKNDRTDRGPAYLPVLRGSQHLQQPAETARKEPERARQREQRERERERDPSLATLATAPEQPGRTGTAKEEPEDEPGAASGRGPWSSLNNNIISKLCLSLSLGLGRRRWRYRRRAGRVPNHAIVPFNLLAVVYLCLCRSLSLSVSLSALGAGGRGRNEGGVPMQGVGRPATFFAGQSRGCDNTIERIIIYVVSASAPPPLLAGWLAGGCGGGGDVKREREREIAGGV